MIETLTGNSKSAIMNSDVSQINSARLQCENVYNVAHGQIVFIGAENGRAIINVKCNPSEILRYGNIKELNCAKGYYADIGAKLGVADSYVEFEYCTLWRGNSNYPVRVNDKTYYKQDPTEVLNGLYTVRKDGAQEQGYTLNRNRKQSFTQSESTIFGENVYDKRSQALSKQAESTPKSRSVLRKLAAQNRSRITKRSDETDGLG